MPSQTVIRGQETTENIPSARRVRDVSRRIAYLDPDAAPFTVVMLRSSSRPASNSRFEWQEKGRAVRWDALNDAGGALDSDTNLNVDHGEYFSIGDIVQASRTGEKMRVTDVDAAGDNIDVVRSVGTTPAAALLDNDDLQIIGNAYAEGATSGSAKSVAETFPYNLTQITRTPLGATRTEQNSENYGGPDRTRLRLEKAVEHKIDLERTALFGERMLDNTDPAEPIRYSGGVLFYCTENAMDFGGLVSEGDVGLFMQNVFAHTGAGDSRVFLASPTWITALDNIALGRVQVVDRAETFGVTVRRWVSSHGELLIVKHRLLENSPTPAGVVGGPFGWAGHALALDFSRFAFRPLANSQTMLQTDIQANDYDGWKDEYLTEGGWEIKNPEVHGIATGATG